MAASDSKQSVAGAPVPGLGTTEKINEDGDLSYSRCRRRSIDLVHGGRTRMSSARLVKLKEKFQVLLDEEKSGGYQLLIARRGQVVMFENLDWADVEKHILVTDDTLFRLASMTKPVTSVAMMMLYEEGISH